MTEDFLDSITPAEITLVALKKIEMDGTSRLLLSVEFERNIPIAMELLWQAYQVLNEAKRQEHERMRPIRQKEFEEWRAQARQDRNDSARKEMSRGRNNFPADHETMMITTIDIRIIWEKGVRIVLLRQPDLIYSLEGKTVGIAGGVPNEPDKGMVSRVQAELERAHLSPVADTEELIAAVTVPVNQFERIYLGFSAPLQDGGGFRVCRLRGRP
jgi:hypothetical protein